MCSGEVVRVAHLVARHGADGVVGAGDPRPVRGLEVGDPGAPAVDVTVAEPALDALDRRGRCRR